jgi:transcriptional regulator with XRE-family HTH domain
MANSLAEYLRGLRQAAGMTLRDVEQASGEAVSNVYLSQLENGRRTDPNPRYLVALAQVYGVPAELLFEKAGYVTPPQPSAVEIAFRQVLADSSFKFGTRFKGELDDEGKRFVIELYERATGKRLLPDAGC